MSNHPRLATLLRLVFVELPPLRHSSLAIALGVAYCFSIFDLAFVLNEHFYRLGHRDMGLNYLGYLFFVRDEWRFPLFETANLGYPFGTNIILTDSTPLLALVCKLLSPILPQEFSPFGLWILLCYLLLAHAFSSLLFHLGHRHALAAAAGALFAVMTPYFMGLLEIASLESHFLLVYALLLYFKVADSDAPQRPLAWFAVLLIASLLINFYYFAMVLTLYCCAVVNLLLRQEERRLAGISLAFTIPAIVLTMFVAGYLPSGVPLTSSSGFGHFSMNLLAPFASFQAMTENEIRILGFALEPDATGGQFEGGFTYWGHGIFFLLLATTPVWLRQVRRVFSVRLGPLLAGLLGLSLLALSNQVYLGQFFLFSYDIPAPLLSVANQVHSSGRFFWVVSYAVMTLALSHTLAIRRPWVMLAVLVGGFSLQYAETRFFRDVLQDRTRSFEPQLLTKETWQPVVAAHRVVALVPPTQCGGMRDIYPEIGHMAAASGVAMHSVWAGRFTSSAPESCRRLLRDILESGFSSGTLYIFDSVPFRSIQRRPELAQHCGELERRYVCTLQRASMSLPPLPPDPGPALWPAQTRRLDAPGLEPFLGLGWSDIEGTGVWSLGNQSEMFFRLASCNDATALQVFIFPFTALQGQSVVAAVNGGTPVSRSYAERLVDSLILPIENCDPKDPVVSASFTADATSPLEAGESGDARPLGFILLEAELIP